MDAEARRLFKEFGHPPGWLGERTPHELLFLFGADPNAGRGVADPVASLAAWNARWSAVRGVSVPPWLMPKAPRRLRLPSSPPRPPKKKRR